MGKSKRSRKRRSRSKKKDGELWIGDLKEGTLRKYVYDTMGKEGFTQKGTIKVTVVRKIAKREKIRNTRGQMVKPSELSRKRAQAALNLRQVNPHLKKK